MSKKIKLQKNNDKRDWSDVKWIEEFYEFLQGTIPEGLNFRASSKVKLTQQKAFAIIWFLQEQLPVFPDQIEKCDTCGCLYDSYTEGHYYDRKRKPNHVCGNCI